MTAQNRSVNKAKFEQGDKPQGSDYVDLIDSYLSLSDTATQTISSDVVAPKLIATTEVSAVLVNATKVSASAVLSTTVSCQNLYVDVTAKFQSLEVSGTVAATRIDSTGTAALTELVVPGLAVISALNLKSFVTSMATTQATTGGGTRPTPATAAGYLVVQVCGRSVGIPYFNVT